MFKLQLLLAIKLPFFPPKSILLGNTGVSLSLLRFSYGHPDFSRITWQLYCIIVTTVFQEKLYLIYFSINIEIHSTSQRLYRLFICNCKQTDYTWVTKGVSCTYILCENVILNREIRFIKFIPCTLFTENFHILKIVLIIPEYK